MPLRAGASLVVAALFLGGPAGAALAQSGETGSDRFFFDATEKAAEKESTTYDGSLTSTSFYYRENGNQADALSSNTTGPFTASPVDRLFTDLRAQLDAKHIGGSRAYFRMDLRGRFTTSTYSTRSHVPGNDGTQVPFQTGTLYGNEFEARELYVRFHGRENDVSFGRQYSLDLAATKFDGVKFEHQGKSWRTILFGGLYPARGSRDVRDDYPYADGDVGTPGYQGGGQVITPISAGLGAAYRVPSAYGAIGAVGIMPLTKDQETKEQEKPRVFATASGYWRASSSVDLYHYLVVDATGASGAGLTNLTLGINLQPTSAVRAYGTISRIDTETLNVTAQTKLQNPDSNMDAAGLLQNNIEVQRIAQDSARVGLSGNIADRFEISTSGALRRRGELRLEALDGDPANPDDDTVFPEAQAADITIALVDRRSLGDMRLGLSGTRSFDIGSVGLNRSKATIARLDATREIGDGRAEIEGSLTYIGSSDDNRGTRCVTSDIETCYGAAEVKSFTLGALAFYRFRPEWFLVASGAVGRQLMDATDSLGKMVTQPAILTSTFFLRLAYRF